MFEANSGRLRNWVHSLIKTWSRWMNETRMRLLRMLILLLIAEIVTATQAAWIGMIIHANIVVWLAVRSSTAGSQADRRLLAALMMAPLIRLTALGMPLQSFPETQWPGLVAVPVLMATVLCVRQTGLGLTEIGVSSRGWRLQIALGGLGLGLGAIGYVILGPELLPDVDDGGDVLLSVVGAGHMLAAATNELVFRGLILSRASVVLGRHAAVIATSLVYAILQIGHGSVANLALALATGVVFGYIALLGNSILGVASAHAIASLILYVVLPEARFADISWAIAGGSVVGLLAAAVVIRRNWQPEPPDPRPRTNVGLHRC